MLIRINSRNYYAHKPCWHLEIAQRLNKFAYNSNRHEMSLNISPFMSSYSENNYRVDFFMKSPKPADRNKIIPSNKHQQVCFHETMKKMPGLNCAEKE